MGEKFDPTAKVEKPLRRVSVLRPVSMWVHSDQF